MKDIINENLVNSRQVKHLVASPNLCMRIKQGFTKSAFFWQAKTVGSRTFVLMLNEKGIMHQAKKQGYRCFPAPTLEECIREILSMGYVYLEEKYIVAQNGYYYIPTCSDHALLIYLEIAETRKDRNHNQTLESTK